MICTEKLAGKLPV